MNLTQLNSNLLKVEQNFYFSQIQFHFYQILFSINFLGLTLMVSLNSNNQKHV